MNNKEKRISENKERAYIQTFAGYFPAANKNSWRDLRLFANTRKTLLAGFLSYSVNRYSVETGLFAGGKRANVRFACLQLVCGLQIFVNYASISKRKESL